jgi:ABC-type transporter Mla subunit MlaD
MSKRWTNKVQRRQDHIEQALAHMAGVLTDLDEVILRNKQAVRRTDLVKDVLDPALARLVEIQRELEEAQAELVQAWKAGRRGHEGNDQG